MKRDFSISQIPLYVRMGSIIPMQPKMSHTGEKPIDPLILTVFPLRNGQVSKYSLYEDAADTPGYQYKECSWTPIEAALDSDGSVLTVTVAPPKGHFREMQTERAYELHLPRSWPPSSVSVNGESLGYSDKSDKVGWRFEGNTLMTVITTRRFSIANTVTVTMRISPQLARNRSMLDGFAGAMTRLRETYDILNITWPVAWAPDPLIDAMQTGDRISYHPDTAFAEVGGLQAKLPGLAKAIEAMHATETSAAFAMTDLDKKDQSQKLEEYNGLVDAALAHIADINQSPSVSSIDKTKHRLSQEIRYEPEPRVGKLETRNSN